MDGKLAEAVLLTSHVRVAFANSEPFTLSLQHPSFRGTSSLVFETDDGQGWSGPATQVATDLSGWFEYLQSSGVQSCALVGGVFGVSRTGAEHLWQQSTGLVQPRPADGRIWAVRYREFASKHVGPVPRPSLDPCVTRLLEVLDGCQTLARDASEAGWETFFANARNELDPPAGNPQPKSHLLPQHGYSSAAQRLLRGCELSWAFGGTGSWTDLYLADDDHARRYDRLTPLLKTAVLDGISAAVNSELQAN